MKHTRKKIYFMGRTDTAKREREPGCERSETAGEGEGFIAK